MSKEKKIDETITTIGDLQYALRSESLGLQIYMQRADESDLIEITEITKIFAKNKDSEPYIVLRCK